MTEVLSVENILFVAVSQNMANLAEKLCFEMDLQIPIVVGSITDCEALVKCKPNVDVFISRGGTADRLQQLSGKHVVHITCSIHDILEPIRKLTANGINKVAVLAGPTLIGEDTYNYKIADTEIYMHPCDKLNELEKIMPQLKQRGVTGVVAGTLASTVAVKYGMKVEMLDTKVPSIKGAIKEAVAIAKAQENERLREEEKAEEIHQVASKLSSDIEQATAAVEELASSSEELAAASQETTNIANKAFKEVDNTSTILEVIRNVAKQTNLLGLNAAIEASRAGEYGRGFSVVAKEVRKLAKESSVSAGNIDKIINQFRSSVEAVLKNVEQSNVITQEQAKANQDIAYMIESLRDVSHKLMSMAERK